MVAVIQGHTFHAICRQRGEKGTTGFVEVPFDVKATFGRARPPVKVTVNDHSYHSTVSVYGGKYYLPMSRANREAAGIEIGQQVTVFIELDTEPRIVVVPQDLQVALAEKHMAGERFQALSYTHQREYVQWICEAKREETRQRRIQKTVEKLAH